MNTVGKAIPRIESDDKVTGFAKYTNDTESPRLLHGVLVTSTYAHAELEAVDIAEALQLPGVIAVVTGKDNPVLTGTVLADRPPLAVGKVRYFGEPVAVAVAENEHTAALAAALVRVKYKPLPVVNSPRDALLPDAPLIHEKLGSYVVYGDAYPVPGTNIGNHVKIRKGDMQAGWAASEMIVEEEFAFAPSDHAAMEPRCSIAEAMPGGQIHIETSTQDPYIIKRLFERYFHVDEKNVVVHVPFVGGGFGGKGSIQLEYIAYLASKACGGRPVKINNTRETDMVSSPCHIGLQARVRLGATRDGRLTAAKFTFWFDTGGYTDQGAVVTKAGAVNCTGPYRIDNVWCDALCVYTNHPYATSFRGFGHPEAHFCMERTLDLLAKRLGMNPLELRQRNAIVPGDTTPTQAPLNRSNIGDFPRCLSRLKELIRWDGGQVLRVSEHRIRAKGMAGVWKTSSAAMESGAGAIVTFNHNGSMNLSVGAVELGQGNRTIMGQILAERMTVPVEQVHVKIEVDTAVTPEHWKTVGSTSTMMVGRAVLHAAADAEEQLKANAALVLKRSPGELALMQGKVVVRAEPGIGLPFAEIAAGYRRPDGSMIGEPVIGRGRYMIHHLSLLDPETGRGVPGPQWTVGAQAVEIELDTREFTYRILRAASVFDAGKVINEGTARGQIMGGMSMGLSFASRETFQFDKAGVVLNPQLRTYKLIRFGENPEYLVDFVETPYAEGPYGARGIGEYGTIGMAPALANALSLAAGVELNRLPLTPELIWRYKGGSR
ncbi:xanthine dehydrogenase family protein molybdopterin-binding subunit [Paenibacillus filicis]|uniref:Xanthine dehydrogenase family protein molybdopterin-binding subunit n=1 Tax=Paenibacillus gyeongsangnamensis TaxID=3388067 RepID=A0ABT4QA97_9BACL|nr:xanthine dehydrogenase family protein molybdopterin-binding subunit [Paenibacillus filicis]MCZ8513763.1 xanthine dehydrogenase family protein molybdopterin-binding subunit [Paenibacillus filicis]